MIDQLVARVAQTLCILGIIAAAREAAAAAKSTSPFSLRPLADVSKFASEYNYTYDLSVDNLRAGVSLPGSNTRLKRVLAKLARGQAIKIGALGGSITAGCCAGGHRDWFRTFTSFLQNNYGNNKVQARNGALGATRSTFHWLCYQERIPSDTDLVLLETTVNDGSKGGAHTNSSLVHVHEQLIRKLLRMPNKPAVIIVHFHRCCQRIKQENNTDTWIARPFHDSLEDRYSVVAQYYRLPILSMRNALFHAHSNKEPKLTFGEIFGADKLFLHPNAMGHKYMADLAVYALHQTMLDMAIHPAVIPSVPPIPTPMFPGNEAARNLLCWIDQKLQTSASRLNGFKYMADSKKKYGYIAMEPGSSLEFVITAVLGARDGRSSSSSSKGNSASKGSTSSRSGSKSGGGDGKGIKPLAPAPGADVPRAPPRRSQFLLYLSYLHSYEHMGQARVECISGCSCTPQIIDGHDDESASQVYMTWVVINLVSSKASTAATTTTTTTSSSSVKVVCRIRVTTLNSTRSGEHKVKISGLMATEYLGTNPLPLVL